MESKIYNQELISLVNDINDIKREYIHELDKLDELELELEQIHLSKQIAIEQEYIDKHSIYKVNDLIFCDYLEESYYDNGLYLITKIQLSTTYYYPIGRNNVYGVYDEEIKPEDIYIYYYAKKINKNGKPSTRIYTFSEHSEPNKKKVGTITEYNTPSKLIKLLYNNLKPVI